MKFFKFSRRADGAWNGVKKPDWEKWLRLGKIIGLPPTANLGQDYHAFT